jgi:hypothetical protein
MPNSQAIGVAFSDQVIVGGSVDNSPIGATTPSTGAFTSLSSTSDVVLAGAVAIQVTDTDAAVRITQLGAGNALLVEDSANPDASPFVVDANGNVGIGITSPSGAVTNGMVLKSSNGFNPSVLNWNAASDSSPPLFVLRKDRAGAIVQSGDELGRILIAGYDGTNFYEAVRISAAVDGTPGTNDMPGRITLSTTADGASSPTERMRIDSAGITTITGTGIINANSTTDALRITQIGAGNALVVEDSANPDATPFTVDTNGRVIQGATQTYPVNNAGTNFTPFVQTHIATANTPTAGFAGFNWATTTGASAVTFAKSRGGTIGTHSIVSNGDILGSTIYYGSDGTNFIPAAQIDVGVDGTPGTNDMPGRVTISTTPDGSVTPLERVRVDSAGNVGVGTTANASALLDVQSTTKGVRMPNMTTTQKNAISSPAAGLMVFDTTLAKLCVYTGSAWQTVTSV